MTYDAKCRQRASSEHCNSIMGLEPESSETVVGALLPIVVTLLLGYFAGWHHDFGAEQAAVLNRMVMLYALPLSLFTGILSTNRSALTSDVGLVGAIAAAMIVPYAIAFVVARYAFRIDPGRAALIALAIGVPAVPFVGTTVLGYLFGGSTAAIRVTAAALPMNLVLVPVSLVVLAAGAILARSADRPVLPRGHRWISRCSGERQGRPQRARRGV